MPFYLVKLVHGSFLFVVIFIKAMLLDVFVAY